MAKFSRVAVYLDGKLIKEWFDQNSDFNAYHYIENRIPQSVAWAIKNGWEIVTYTQFKEVK